MRESETKTRARDNNRDGGTRYAARARNGFLVGRKMEGEDNFGEWCTREFSREWFRCAAAARAMPRRRAQARAVGAGVAKSYGAAEKERRNFSFWRPILAWGGRRE